MEKTLRELEDAVNTNPFDESLRAAFASLLLENKQYDKAEHQLRLLVQQFPNNKEYEQQLEEIKKTPLEHPSQTLASEKQALENASSDEPLPKKRLAGLSLVEGDPIPFEKHNVVNLARADKVRFVDIAGMENVKKLIKRRIIDPFINPSLFQKFRRKAGGGVLLYGPPGCGKTMIARAIATECHASFHSVGISDILNMYIGQSESNLANIFAQARNNTPAVIFFDELDALAYSRSKANSDHTRTIVNEFLNQLDGMNGENDQVLILGATNMPWDVDDAMKRPGRFDRQFFVPPPDAEAIAEMLTVKLQEVPCESINFNVIAKQCKQFSGADIDGLIEIAKDQVLDDIMESGNERRLSQEDLQEAVSEASPSTIEWMQTAVNLVKYANAAGSYKDVAKYLKSQGIY